MLKFWIENKKFCNQCSSSGQWEGDVYKKHAWRNTGYSLIRGGVGDSFKADFGGEDGLKTS